MCFGRLWPRGGRSPASSKPQKPKRKTKRDKKAKNFNTPRAKHGSSSHSHSNSDDEGTIPTERQTDGPFQGLANGFRDVGTFLNQVHLDPSVRYMIPWVLAAFAGLQVFKLFELPTPALDKMMSVGMAQPAVAWPMAIMAFIQSVPAILNWWTADEKNQTTSTVPKVRLLSPISTEEAFVIPEYLTKVESSVTRSNVMDGTRLPLALEDSFRRAMDEAELFKEINDGLMADIELRFAGHHDQLAQIHVDIERAVIDIADRNDTKTSFWDRCFTTGQPYTRARRHHSTLLSITNDMIKASISEMDRLEQYRDELDKFKTLDEHHGAICGLRSRTLKFVSRWTKETKDIRAEVKVMCDSARHSKKKLAVVFDALKDHLVSVDAVRKGLSALQHDRAETLEAALLSYCKSLLEAMQTLAKFGNA
ncbi:hypothetical protein CEP51_000312 [Fusarium floridanum]|uniref:Uncharacterized protein n=1 Tax=Fusarium floridanum TaxID=1325733 RepID=A0A428SNJ2_9HYPO|nr:hypothetical protein CEP51_000312 [Fusarium floridanum]